MKKVFVFALYTYRVYIWLITSLFFFAYELTTPGHFFFLAFGIGSCAGALCAWYNMSFVIQAICSLIVSLISVWLLRKFFTQHIQTKSHIRTNYEALAGQTGIVTAVIKPHQSGQVKAKGEIWAAKSEQAITLESGSVVSITRIVGNHLIVKKLQSNEGPPPIN